MLSYTMLQIGVVVTTTLVVVFAMLTVKKLAWKKGYMTGFNDAIDIKRPKLKASALTELKKKQRGFQVIDGEKKLHAD